MLLDKVKAIILRYKEESPYGFWSKKEGLPCFTFFGNQKVTSWFRFESIEDFCVTLEENCHVRLIETNPNIRYQLLSQSSLQHISDKNAENLQFLLQKAANLKHFARITSSEHSEGFVSIQLLEANAVVDWQEGLYLNQSSYKTSIEINHLAAQTRSNCCVKAILEQASMLQFTGNVYVQKEAEGAVAHQRNLNHILDADSRVVSLPNLHVFNRKIEASHGTATQPIPEETLFYLRSRGLLFEQAKQVYFDSFLGKMPLEEFHELL